VIGKDVDAGERDVEVAIVLLTIKKTNPSSRTPTFTWLWRAAIPWLKFQASGKWLTTNGSFGLRTSCVGAWRAADDVLDREANSERDLDQILLLVQKIDDGS